MFKTDSRYSVIYILITGIGGSFLTYFSMYAFRKPFAAAEYEGLEVGGIDLKILFITSQTIGYTCSKFLGIKFISEMFPKKRITNLLLLIGISWIALLTLPVLPLNLKFLAFFFNGIPLGLIWGLVFSFLEGRQKTELLAVALSSSFIVSSGVVKSVGLEFLIAGVDQFWMPFLTGMVFIPLLLLGVKLLSKMPPPSIEDNIQRSKREPMNGKERTNFLLEFGLGTLFIIIIYMALSAYRDYRDNFAVEIWSALKLDFQPKLLILSELPVAFFVLFLISTVVMIRSNRLAFYLNFLILGAAGLMLLISTFLKDHLLIDPFVWIIVSGSGMYAAYVSFNAVLFERWIAFYRIKGNIGFLIYLVDSFGYLASLILLFVKNFGYEGISMLKYFNSINYLTGWIILIFSLFGSVYFFSKEKAYFKIF